MSARAQEEILTRIAQMHEEDDFFGFRREVLVEALDFVHAQPLLKPEVTEAEWGQAQAPAAENARAYLGFAIGKILGHRGISALRSVDKLAEHAWLLGRDDVVAAMAAAPYPQYGAAKVKTFADGMGWPWPTDDPMLARMARGLACHERCESGCGKP